MLRLALLALLLAPLAAAQTPTFTSGIVVGTAETSLGRSALDGVRGARGVSVGVQRASGLDYGLGGALAVGAARTGWRVGPTVGLTRRLAGPLHVRVGGEAAVERRRYTRRDAEAFLDDRTVVTAVAGAAVGVDLGLVGSLRLAPAVGSFAALSGTLAQDASRVREDLLTLDRPSADAPTSFVGVSAELPLSFRLLGTTVELASRIEVVSLEPIVAPDASTSLRITF